MPNIRPRVCKPKAALIHITLNPARVEDVAFEAAHPLDQQFLFEVWPTIRPLVDKIDRTLRRTMTGVLSELRRQDRAS